MKKKRLFVILSVLIFFVALGASTAYFSENEKRLSAPKNSIPNTDEAKKVMEAISTAYTIEAEVASTFDLTKFPDIFINDPRFPVNSSTLETIRELTNNPALNSAGYLDYKMAYYTWWRNGALRLEALQEQARKEGRSLTEEETKSLTDATGRRAMPRPQGPIWYTELNFISLVVNDDVATVVLDDGAWTLQMILVYTNDQWYIAGSHGLSFHP